VADEANDAPNHPADWDSACELSSNRTAMSFERTLMSSDRTLMSAVRTSLSLIGFGFTIFQFFHSLGAEYLKGELPPAAPQRFGAALVVLGIVLLVMGILEHLREARSRRARRARLYAAGLIRHVETVKPSNILIVAALLLLIGLAAFGSIVFRVGPL